MTNTGTPMGDTTPVPLDVQATQSSPPGPGPRRRGGRLRALSAWLIVLLLVPGAAVGARALVRERQQPPTTLSATEVRLVAESFPLGPGDAVSPAVVSTVVVRAGEEVAAGEPLATVRFAQSVRGARTIPAYTKSLVAPRDAVVVAVERTPGTVVRPGEQVLSLYFPDELAFHATVSIVDLQSLKVGMTATIEGPGLTAPIDAAVGRVIPTLGDGPEAGRALVALIPRDPADVRSLVPGLPFNAVVDLTSAPPGAPPVTDSGA